MENDTVKHVENSNLVQMSRKLLEALVESTAILNGGESKVSDKGLKEAKTVLGYLNASINATQNRMQWFKMTGLNNKIKLVQGKGVKK